jgi:hypothetical protein
MLLCSFSGGCQEVEKIQGKLGDNPLEKVRLFASSLDSPLCFTLEILLQFFCA